MEKVLSFIFIISVILLEQVFLNYMLKLFSIKTTEDRVGKIMVTFLQTKSRKN